MTENEFSILKSPLVRKLVEENLGADPARLALSLKCGREEALAVCGQVKYLQRARAKLPSYYAARCVLPPLAFEQCSSEAAAGEKDYSGGLCIDLTCGLGVDSLHLSKRFERVISVECDPLLASVARYNFELLGATNITVVNCVAEDFLTAYAGEKAALVYADPARRGGSGEKLVVAADCSPDVAALLPVMVEKAEKVLVKLSPMFDTGEVFNIFSPCVSMVETVSVSGECKELLVEFSRSAEVAVVGVTIAGGKRYSFRREEMGRRREDAVRHEDLEGRYLLIPDAGFYKNRVAVALAERYFPGVSILSENGFFVSDGVQEDFPGRVFRIERVDGYRPALLKKQFKEQGIKRINTIRRGFPYSASEICRGLGVNEGGSVDMAFAVISGKPFALLLGR